MLAGGRLQGGKEMARKRGSGWKEPKPHVEKTLSRRDFFRNGAAAGVGAAVLPGPDALAQDASSGHQGIVWNYEADVVVLGSGCVGLHAAVRARDLGASVLVIDQNFDVGGKLVHSGGWTSLGGGDPIQERDRTGTDPDRLGLTAPRVKPADLEDDPDRLFRDMTDWSVVDETGVARYRYNDRELHRAWADNAARTRQFMMDNYVRFARIDGTHQGGGMSRARAARAMMKLADKTDIKAGTISPQDRGDLAGERHSPFNPMRTIPGGSGEAVGAPGWVWGGFAISRSMEFSAREKGVRFMLNRHMDGLIREQPFAGRVLGVKAGYTPRMHPETGARLESFWQNGNIDERAGTIYIRARKAVIIATGGMHGNVHLRTMIDPRMNEPSIEYGPSSLIGPLNMDGSGIIAGMRIGGNLAGMMQNYQHSLASPTISTVLGTRDAVASIFPGHPSFLFARAKGIAIGAAGWEHAIAVNQVGRRFYNERAIADISSDAQYPPGREGTRTPFVPLDWRNASPAQVRAQYKRSAAADAALAMNEGSQAPDYTSGPVWAIFDSAAVQRGGWQIRYPYIADPPDGYFHKADTLAELAKKVTEHPHQRMPLKYLEETVARYNAFADKGVDEDFEKPVMHRIDTPPFYAAWASIRVLDSYGGLRINGKAQVIDTQGEVIPGLYAGGEASGGGSQHGIGRATVHGYIAGTNAAQEPSA
jgi:FAD binding domain-containing protein